MLSRIHAGNLRLLAEPQSNGRIYAFEYKPAHPECIDADDDGADDLGNQLPRITVKNWKKNLIFLLTTKVIYFIMTNYKR